MGQSTAKKAWGQGRSSVSCGINGVARTDNTGCFDLGITTEADWGQPRLGCCCRPYSLPKMENRHV